LSQTRLEAPCLERTELCVERYVWTSELDARLPLLPELEDELELDEDDPGFDEPEFELDEPELELPEFELLEPLELEPAARPLVFTAACEAVEVVLRVVFLSVVCVVEVVDECDVVVVVTNRVEEVVGEVVLLVLLEVVTSCVAKFPLIMGVSVVAAVEDVDDCEVVFAGWPHAFAISS